MRTFIICCAFCAGLMFCKQAVATEANYLDTTGDRPVPEEAKQPAQIVTAKPLVKLTENDSTLFGVRCWQNGQLILEDTNWSAPQLSERFVAMRKVGSPKPGIYLVDFQHTFCELKQR